MYMIFMNVLIPIVLRKTLLEESQDGWCMCHATLWCVRATIIAVETQNVWGVLLNDVTVNCIKILSAAHRCFYG
jgi:hypothetical protein